MLNESNIPLEEDGIEEEILVDEEVAITKAMWGDIGGNIANQTDLQNALDAKQDSLTEAQLDAVNSGITAGKVATYDGYADQIASKADQSALNAEATTRGEADTALGTRIDNEALARQQADNGLQTQIDAITSKSDVVDVVANYAALQAYDTSTLGNNDVIKVLDDETHEDALTYYRWSTATQTWSYIGQEAPYYSKGQMDVKLAQKQDKLTAGTNIQIQNGTISATDTTYTAGNGLNLNGTEFSADTDVLATKEDLEDYYTKTETDNLLAPKLETEVVAELPSTGEEGKLYLTPKAHTTQTATGNPITATVSEDAGKMESFQLDGDTFQQSYEGKNLVGLTDNTVSQGGLTATIEGDTVTINGTATGSAVNLCPVNFNLAGMGGKKPAVSIFPISGSWTGGAIGFSLRDSSNTQVFFQQVRYDGLHFNSNTLTESELASADHAFLFAGATTVFSNFKFKIMLSDSPAIETTYEPYVGGQPSPNPDYPQPIQTVTGTQTVEIVGKNIFGTVPYWTDSTISDTGERISNPNYDVFRLQISGGATYTFSDTNTYAGSATAVRGVELDSAGHNVKLAFYRNRTTAGRFTDSFTADASTSYLLIQVRKTDEQIQLELGSTPTVYTPYSKQTYPIDLGDIELCKLGDYQDYIWKDGNEWKLHKDFGEANTLDADIVDRTQTATSGKFRYIFGMPAGTPAPKVVTAADVQNVFSGYCSGLRPATRGSTYSGVNNVIGPTDGNFYKFAVFYAEEISSYSLGQALEWLHEKAFDIVYELETPTDTVITDTELIAQLEAIRTALLQNGANTITNTATGLNLAGDMEIGYYGYNPRNRYDKWLWLDINNEYEQIGS